MEEALVTERMKNISLASKGECSDEVDLEIGPFQ
jgi:hypothetical protein